VLTQIEPQGTLHIEACDTLEQLGVDVLDVGLGRRVAFHHSVIEGLGVTEYELECKAASEVRRLFKSVRRLTSVPSSQQEGAGAAQPAEDIPA
jgi:hypothetical protein